MGMRMTFSFKGTDGIRRENMRQLYRQDNIQGLGNRRDGKNRQGQDDTKEGPPE